MTQKKFNLCLFFNLTWSVRIHDFFVSILFTYCTKGNQKTYEKMSTILIFVFTLWGSYTDLHVWRSCRDLSGGSRSVIILETFRGNVRTYGFLTSSFSLQEEIAQLQQHYRTPLALKSPPSVVSETATPDRAPSSHQLLRSRTSTSIPLAGREEPAVRKLQIRR